MPGLESSLRSRDTNNIDFLRLLAASLVILGHSFALSGYGMDPLLRLTAYHGFGQLGVDIFFVLSGMLIARSWLLKPHPSTFVSRRCLRIFPALIASTFFCVFVVGPMATEFPWRVYFGSRSTYDFLWNGLAPAHTYFIPGVFERNPNTGVNGSMWTLPVELCCYATVLICGITGLLQRKFFPLVILTTLASTVWPCIMANLTRATNVNMLHGLGDKQTCIVFFLLGAASYIYQERLPMNRWLALAMAALYLGTTSTGPLGYVASFISIPYLVVFTAQTRVPALAGCGRWGDPSYGLYIYAFPIQQLIVHLSGSRIGAGALFGSSLVFTSSVAYASWHLLEQPLLSLGRRHGHGAPEGASPHPPAGCGPLAEAAST